MSRPYFCVCHHKPHMKEYVQIRFYRYEFMRLVRLIQPFFKGQLLRTVSAWSTVSLRMFNRRLTTQATCFVWRAAPSEDITVIYGVLNPATAAFLPPLGRHTMCLSAPKLTPDVAMDSDKKWIRSDSLLNKEKPWTMKIQATLRSTKCKRHVH